MPTQAWVFRLPPRPWISNSSPITRERYDLVFPTSLLDDLRMRLLLDIIRSSRFIEQARAMGGYEVEETGRIVGDSEA